MVLFQFAGSVALTTFPLDFFLGGVWDVLGATFDTNIGGWLAVPIGYTGVKTIVGVGGGLGGVRYQMGRPNVKLGRLRVSMKNISQFQMVETKRVFFE